MANILINKITRYYYYYYYLSWIKNVGIFCCYTPAISKMIKMCTYVIMEFTSYLHRIKQTQFVLFATHLSTSVLFYFFHLAICIFNLLLRIYSFLCFQWRMIHNIIVILYFIVGAICMLRSITQLFVVLLIVCYFKGLSIFICTLLLPFVSTTATQWPCHINHLHNGSPYLLIVGHMIIESNTPTQNYVLCGGFSKTNSFGLLPKYYLWIFMAFDGTFFVASCFFNLSVVFCVWWCCGLELMSLFIITIGGGGVGIHVWSMLLIFYNSISKT